MARIGAFTLLMIFIALLFGCSQSSESTEQTGIELSFNGCLTFAAWVWIDGDYIGAYTSEEPQIIEIAAGSHSLFARSNMVVADTSHCWEKSFAVADGQITEVILDCAGARCETPTTLEMLNPAIKR